VATILTGLLSFMLADEITTGSISSTDLDKKAFAKKSHDFNRGIKKFREIFPEYSDEEMKDLPNMGEVPRSKETQEAVASAPPASSFAAVAPADARDDADTKVALPDIHSVGGAGQ